MEKPGFLAVTYQETDRKQSYLINLNAVSRCLYEQNGDVRSLHIHYTNGAEADKFTGEVATYLAGLVNEALIGIGKQYNVPSQLW